MVTPGEYNSRSVIVQGFKTNGFFHRETMSDMMHMMLKKRSASLRMLILGITALMLIPSGLFLRRLPWRRRRRSPIPLVSWP